MRRLNKTTELLRKLSKHEVYPETKALQDPGLLELFSWHTSRSPRARIKDTLRLLVKRGLLNQGSVATKVLYSITPEGKAYLKQARAAIDLPRPPRSWNGRWHFVSYQIASEKKNERNQLIAELKQLGFLRAGPALWVFPYDFSSYLEKRTTALGIPRALFFIEATTISDITQWQKRFGIKQK